MAKLIPRDGPDDELPEVQCSECDVIFSVVWHRNGFTDGIDYCPFCGEEIER